MICSVEGCGKAVLCRGLCSRHYTRLQRHGSTADLPRSPERLPLAERLRKYVDRRGPDECWPWIGRSITEGYGMIGVGPEKPGKKYRAQVAAWIVANGPLPRGDGYHGMVVRHVCHNRLCCNPAHLELGTQAENVKDMWANKTGPRGNSRLTEDQVRAIRADSRSCRALAEVYGVHNAHISSIRRRRTWKTI